MKIIKIILLSIMLLGIGEKVIVGKVEGVKDGDTIIVVSENIRYTIRLDAIDAPEKKQEFGTVSKQTLTDLILGQEVTIKYKKKDRYDRILGKVYLHGDNINLKMVELGMAWHYKEYNKEDEYAEAEEFARVNHLGLWLNENPIYPHNFRKLKNK